MSAAAAQNVPTPAPPLTRRIGVTTGGKLMRLRCRFRPLHDTYWTNGLISERDSDVTFTCGDGSKLRAHKIILASASKFFVTMFEEQKCGKMTTVVVPDVKVDTMKIILQLAYKDTVSLSMKQIKDVGNCISMFGMAWSQFNFEGFDGVSTNPVTVPSNSGLPSLTRKPGSVQGSGNTGTPQASSVVRQSKGQMSGNTGNIKVEYKAAGITASVPIVVTPTVNVDNDEDSDASDDSDSFTFQLQGYDETHHQEKQPSVQKEQLPMAPPKKPAVQRYAGHHQLRQSPAQSQRLLNSLSSSQPRRRSQQYQGEEDENPSIENDAEGYEDDSDFGSVNANSDEAQMLIKEWMSKVGKEESSSPVKRTRPTTSAGPSRARQPSPEIPQQAENTCTICNTVFDSKKIWKWHEDRHVGLGIFKCFHCDQLFGTSKKVEEHENLIHTVEEEDSTDYIETSSQIPAEFEIKGRKRKLIPREEYSEPEAPAPKKTVPRLTLVKTQHGTHYRRLPSAATKKKMSKKMKLAQMRKYRGSNATSERLSIGYRNPLIGIGASDGTELLDNKKIKQLHWLYVCSNCDKCSDSSSKAMSHYNKCYGKQGMPFEQSVVKYRQGFYGKCKCPLCPRRYTSNGGFMIHCGHMHTEYRRKFTQCGQGEDSIRCISCTTKYLLPTQFHAHLIEGECNDPPRIELENNTVDSKEDSSMPKLSSAESANPFEAIRTKRKVLLSSRSPRSARLANRMANGEGIEDEEKFPAIDCPICGTDSIAKLSEHLSQEHADMGVAVQRVAPEHLRCQKCSITFAICDLLAHTNSCTGTKEFLYVTQRRAASSASAKIRAQTRMINSSTIRDTLPEGVGNSPIETIEDRDLRSVQTLRDAMKCGVCGKEARKLGMIADCLKSHGVHRCALCFNSYSTKHDYSLHLKKCHGNGSSSGRLKCPLCVKNFANAGQVAGHMYSSHWLSILREKSAQDRISRPSSKKEMKMQQSVEERGGNAGNELEGISLNEDEEASNVESSLDKTGGSSPASSLPSVDDYSNVKDDYSNITLGSLLESSKNAAELAAETGDLKRAVLEEMDVESLMDLDDVPDIEQEEEEDGEQELLDLDEGYDAVTTEGIDDDTGLENIEDDEAEDIVDEDEVMEGVDGEGEGKDEIEGVEAEDLEQVMEGSEEYVEERQGEEEDQLHLAA